MLYRLDLLRSPSSPAITATMASTATTASTASTASTATTYRRLSVTLPPWRPIPLFSRLRPTPPGRMLPLLTVPPPEHLPPTLPLLFSHWLPMGQIPPLFSHWLPMPPTLPLQLSRRLMGRMPAATCPGWPTVRARIPATACIPAMATCTPATATPCKVFFSFFFVGMQ